MTQIPKTTTMSIEERAEASCTKSTAICNCIICQLDIMDGYLPLEEKPDKYGRTGKQEDNSLGTF